MVHHKGRLHQMFLHKLLKEQVQNIALGMTVLIVDFLLICQLLSSFRVSYLVKINACILLYRLDHGHPFKRLPKINHILTIRHRCCSAYFLCHVAEHVFRQIHHPVIVSVCLIQLHQGKFRVMPGVKAFVAEYAPNLINTLKTAHDQPL